MAHQLTTKGQVIVPKSVRDFIGVKPGDSVKWEVMADGRAALSPAKKRTTRFEDSLKAFVGIAKGQGSTEELMRMTRGDDWNKP
jgi:antitoxin PrlF